MRMNQWVCGGIAALGLLAASPVATAEGDAEAGEWKAITCMGCHGIEGYANVYPTYRVPKIGGQHPQYLVEALKAYRAGMRAHKTMRAQAASLSDQDMLDIAAYFAQGGSGE